MALPVVGLEAVIENLGEFAKGAGVITKSFDTINAGANSVGKSFLSLGGHVNGFISTVSKTALVGIGALGVGLVGVGASAISAGSDVSEMQSKFEAVFKDTAPESRQRLEELADSIGRNKYELQGMAAEMQDFLVPMGGTREAAADMSIEMVKLAEDVASFNNLNSADVLNDFKSALSGETEPMKKYGVILNEATVQQEAFSLGLGSSTVDAGKLASAQRGLEKAQMSYNEALKKYGADSNQVRKAQLNLEGAQQRVNDAMQGGKAELTAMEKAQAVYSLIMKGTTDAQGDATRTAGGWANQMRALKATVQEAHQELGLKLLPVVTPLLQQFTAMAKDVLPKLVKMFEANVIPVIESTINVFKLLATGDFSGGIFGLDEDSGLIDFLFDVRELVTGTYETFRTLITGDFRGGIFGLEEDDPFIDAIFVFRDAIVELFTTITSGIGIFNPFTTAADDLKFTLSDLISGGLKILTETVLPALTKAIEFVNENWEAFKGAIIGIGAALAGAAIAAAIAGIVAALGAILSPIGLIIVAAAAVGAAWNTNFLGMRDTLTAFWENSAKPALQDLWEWLQVNVPKAIQTASEFWESTLLPAIQTTWKFINDDLIPIIKSVASWLRKNVPVAIDAVVKAIKPVINKILPELIDIFNIIYKWVIKNFPLMQKTIATVIKFITDLFKGFSKDTGKFWADWGDEIMAITEIVFKMVKTSLENMLDVVTLIMQLITGDWKGAWETIKDITDRTLKTILDIVKTIFNSIAKTVSDIMTSIKNKISDIWTEIVNTVKNKVNEVYNSIKAKFDTLATLISGYASKLLEAAKVMMQGVINGILAKATEISTAISTVITNAINNLKNSISGGSLSTLIYGIGQAIVNKIKDGIAAVTDLASKLIAAIQGAINQLVSAISSGTLYNILDNAGRKIITIIRDAIISVTDFVTAVRNKLVEWINQLVSSNLVTALVDTGKKIVQEITNGFLGAQNAFDVARDAIKDWILSWFSPIPEARFAGSEIVDNILTGFYAQRGRFITATRLGLSDWVAQAGVNLNPTINAPMVSAPALGAGGSTSIYNTFNLGGNTISNGMDQAAFEARVLRTIRRNL